MWPLPYHRRPGWGARAYLFDAIILLVISQSALSSPSPLKKCVPVVCRCRFLYRMVLSVTHTEWFSPLPCLSPLWRTIARPLPLPLCPDVLSRRPVASADTPCGTWPLGAAERRWVGARCMGRLPCAWCTRSVPGMPLRVGAVRACACPGLQSYYMTT